MMQENTQEKKTEEKRLKDFQKIAESWDKIPEYARGKIDGTISAVAALCEGSSRKG